MVTLLSGMVPAIVSPVVIRAATVAIALTANRGV